MYPLAVVQRRAFRRVKYFAIIAVPIIAASTIVHSPQDVARAESTIPGDSAAPAPTNVSIAHTPLELDEPATVTLFTGDKVTLHPNGGVETQPGEGRNDIVFDEQKLGDEIHVIPSDAAKLLAEGKLDKRLFDITYLIREGYDDTNRGDMPLIIEGESAAIREVAKGRGMKVQHRSAKLKMSVVAQDKKKDKGGLWSRMASEEEAPATLPEGVEKVWLDGMAHVTLDESVPQIGAPEVWESGYTGEGVTVAVLDTGIDSTHPDLAGQVVAEKTFVDSPLGGALLVDRLGYALAYRIVFGAAPVPIEGSSDPVVDVGRACVESEGDELETDPAGKTALIARGGCTFAEKYDAAVDAGATGVVFYNNEPGLILSGVGEAEHAGEVWATNISADHGHALINALPGGDVTLTFTDDYPGDLNGHGTHVASTIAGTGAASDGLRKGVAPNADLMNGRVCDALGSCQDSWIIAGMEWAAENGADLVNISLAGGPTDGTDPMSQAVNTLTETHDVLFVIAAGNLGDLLGYRSVSTPGAADAALTVGAVDKSDELAWFSSLGPRRGDDAVKPEIAAPGVDIVAARAGGTAIGTPTNADYTAASGTSMATPHVAGAGALLAQAHQEFGAMDLKNALASTATDVGHLWFEQGAGRVDAARAVTQGVRVDTAAISLGTLHASDNPVERQITYTNHTDHVVNLRLDVSITDQGGKRVDAVALSKERVAIRPGDKKSVTVILDPQNLKNSGPYGGGVTAQADGVSVRTAIGFGILREIVPLGDDWEETWAETYTFGDYPYEVRLKGAALSPDGTQLFMYGIKPGGNGQLILTAVDTATGVQLWTSRATVPFAETGPAPGLAVAPDGGTVFVTQEVSDENRSQSDVVTIAYNNTPPQDAGDPEFGDQLWIARHEGISPDSGSRPGEVDRIAITPDGQTVVVVGTQIEPRNGDEQCNLPLSSCSSSMLIIGYDATSGEKLWSARHAGSDGFTTGSDVAISPDGTVAFVTGFEQIDVEQVHARPVTVAYSLGGGTAGDQLWIARHDSATGNYGSWHNAVSDDGERVFVASTVQIDDTPFDERMSTHAYDAATGELLWSAQFGAADYGFAPGHTEPDRFWKGAITVSPDNDLIFVTGNHCEGGTCNTGVYAMVTVAYDQATGEERWSQIHEGIARPARGSGLNPAARTAATSPDGSHLYVVGTCCWSSSTGDDGDQVTLTYDPATGEELATARHSYVGETPFINEGKQVLVHPDGSAIYSVSAILSGSMLGWGVAAYAPPITAKVQASRLHGDWLVDLTWTAPGVNTVDIYRDGDLITTIGAAEAFTDTLGKQRPGSTVDYQVCESNTDHCSQVITVKLNARRSPTE